MAKRGRPVAELALTDEERETLWRWARRRSSSQALAQRCRIVLGCAAGKSNREVAAEVGVWQQTVGIWRQLATAGGIAQPAMTQLVGRLERDGLVVRLIDPDDGRATLVDITDAGQALLAQLRQTQRDNLAEMLKALSPDDEA